MKLYLFLIIFSIIFVLIQVGNSQSIRGCYYTNWAIYRAGRAKFTPEDYAPGLCTHLFFAFAVLNNSYEAKAFDPSDLPNGSDKGQYARIVGLKKHDPKLKIILSFGGWTFSQESPLFKNMASSQANRAKFIKSALSFIKKYGFDGIDLDWEYPDSKANFNALLKELYKASAKKTLVTAAVAAGSWAMEKSYDPATIGKNVDFINLMTYDFHIGTEPKTGFNSPLTSKDNLNIQVTAQAWVKAGMPKNKISIGFPTYGKGWTLANPSSNGLGAAATGVSAATEFLKSPGTGAYFEFCDMLSKGAKRVYDSAAKVPYLYKNNQWFSYDDAQSFKDKLNWVKSQGYGGAFIWSLDTDDFNGKCPGNKLGNYPLMGSIAKILGGAKGPFKSVNQMIGK